MARMVAAVRVGERRWNLQLRSGIDVLLPEGHEAAALDRLAALQQDHALLDRPLEVIDMRLPDRLVLRPRAEPAADPQRRSRHERNRRNARNGRQNQPGRRRNMRGARP